MNPRRQKPPPPKITPQIAEAFFDALDHAIEFLSRLLVGMAIAAMALAVAIALTFLVYGAVVVLSAR